MDSLEEKSKLCKGCREDFYNHRENLTGNWCWNLESAELEDKYAIGWWTPMDKADNFTKVKVYNCYNQRGTIAYLKELPNHLKFSQSDK